MIKVAASIFCREVHGRPGQAISHFGELCSQKPKIGRIGARRMDIGSACVDNRQFPSLAVVVCLYGYGYPLRE